MNMPDHNWRTGNLDALCRALLSLETVDEMALFLRDLCTRTEIEGLSSRWEVATMLESGLPYRQVSEQTGASITTVGRVNEWRRFGTGGYRIALDRLDRSGQDAR